MKPDMEEEPATGVCARTRERLIWNAIPPSAPAEADLTAHLEQCAACGEFMRFVKGIQSEAEAASALHPEPDLLVRFTEDPEGLDPFEHARVTRHLRECPSCREEEEILGAIRREEQGIAVAVSLKQTVEAPRAHPGPRRGIAGRSRLQGVWAAIRGSILQPAPAAVYLVTAAGLLAVVLFGSGRVGPGSDLPPAPRVSVGPVVVLPEMDEKVRDGRDATPAAVRLESDRSHVLILELTSLPAPPRADGLYRVEIVPVAGAEPVFASAVKGEEFLDTYVLYLRLEPEQIPRGSYAVRLLDPNRVVLFLSRLDMR